jgi:hypothetical protein
LAQHRWSRYPQAEVSTSARDRRIDLSGAAITEIIPVDEYARADSSAERYDNPNICDRRGRLLDAGYFSNLLQYFWGFIRTIRAAQWALASSGWITLLCVQYLPSASPPRILLVFGFILFCPGFAVARLVPTREPAERWVVAIALSMSFGLLVSVAFTLTRDDSVTLRVGSLALITTIAVLVEAFVSPLRHTSTAPADDSDDTEQR